MQLGQLWSPLGILSILLAVGGVFLIIWNFFRPELSFVGKEAIVKQRLENLPLLRSNIDAILKRQKELALELGKRPLQSFFDEYLKISKQYKTYRKLLNVYHTSTDTTKHKVAIFISIRAFFCEKTVCLTNVCKSDDHMTKLKAEKDIYYHRNSDKKLSGIIDGLLHAATKYHSVLAFAELATHNDLAYTSAQKYANFEEKPNILKGFMARAYKAMNDRMELLMRGGDL